MTRVLLIQPPWYLRRGNVWKDIGSCMPPRGIAQIASVLEARGISVRILDAQAERTPPPQVAAALGSERYDFIGITATTLLIRSAMEIARDLKKRQPSATLVLGGVHPTVLPEEVLACPSVDYVVRGEGEQTFLELVQGRAPEKIDGLSYRRDGAVVHNRERALLPDLDSLPPPAYHLLPMDRYYPSQGAYRRLPALSMMATRGCGARCTFCYRMFGNRVRVRSARHLIEELRLLRRDYGIREIQFLDDTFTAARKTIMEFCALMAAERVDLTWSCFARVDFIDEELLRSLKAAGCHQIMYGFESADPAVLAAIDKRAGLERAEEAARLTKKVGIDLRGAFMLGNPGETAESMERTLRWAVRMNPDLAVFNITTPYPGTAMFAWAKEQGYLMTEDWDDYDLSRSVMRLPTVTPEEVDRFYREAYRRFYLRPRYILGRLARLHRPHELSVGWKAMNNLLDVFRARER